MIYVDTPSRLHLTLIDMNASLGRVDGGIGITLDRPGALISAEQSDKVQVQGDQAQRAGTAASSVIDAFDIGGGVRVTVDGISPHVGLGSGTQISLAVGMAVCRLYDIDAPVKRIAEIVGRGGTSGIGVAAFEHGGFILDGGHRWQDKGAFSPSAASKALPAPIILRRDFPEWDVVLATPELRGAYGKGEVDIFRQYCPIPIEEVRELSHVILMKMLPALVEEDMQAFGEAINLIQGLGFKRREVELQDPLIRDAMDAMREAGAYGAGMSSFGPTIFAIAGSPETVMNAAEEVLGPCAMITRARNTGARIWES